MSAPSDVFVGRDRDIQALVTAMGMRGGPTSAILIAGDAGVGKTRLLHALRDRALEADWLTAVGHCLDLGDHGLPYLPITEILDRLQSQRPELLAEIMAEHPVLERLASGRRVLGAEAGDAADGSRLFDAVHVLLDRTAADQPLLVVIEDLHWADQSTRDLLTLLFSRPFTNRVAVVASYRSDDLHRRHPLRPMLAQWARLPRVTRFEVEPLGATQVRSMIRQLHPAPLGAAAVNGIVTRAEGNAFFVEELVRVADSGEGIPDSLADLLMVRVDQLSDDALAVLRVLAVIGRRATHEILASGVELPPSRLEAALREAMERHLLVASGDDGYRFRHALLAEAVYDDLLPGERRRLHTRLAEQLQSGEVSGTPAELARHARAAGDLLTAVEAAKRAGDDAMAIGGPSEAAHLYEQALELLADPQLRARSHVDAVDVIEAHAAALVAAGDLARALRIGKQVLAELPDDIPAESRARVLTTFAGSVLLSDSSLDSLQFTEEALSLLDETPTQARARALHWHARSLAFSDRTAEARAAAVEALGLAEQLNLPRLSSDIQTTLAGLDQSEGSDIDRTLQEVARNAATAGATTAELRALTLLGRLRLEQGDFAGADQAFEAAVRRAERMGRSWAPYGFDARFHRIQTAFYCGDWARAERLLQEPRVGALPLQISALAAAKLMLRAGRGDQVSEELLTSAQENWDIDVMVAMTAAPELITLAAGDQARVEAVHERAVQAIAEVWGPRFGGQVRLAAVVIAAASVGVDRLGTRQRRARLAWVQSVESEVGRTLAVAHDSPRLWGPEGRAWEQRFRAESAWFRWNCGLEAPSADELVALLRTDLDGFTALGHVLEQARSQVRLGEVLRHLGDPESKELLAQARATAERLGARPLLQSLPERRTTTLTARELDVLRLVAAGRSNGEIAKQLFIATKTASVHVSNILAKLGAASRTEAAAIARDQDLL